MNRFALVVALMILCALCATAALCQDMAELEVDHALTNDFPTPHTEWAKPYAQGKTRVLFFTIGHNTEPRECVELMQRFDLDAQAVFYATIVDSPKTHWHGDLTGERRMLNLLGQKWDCFVLLAGIGLDKFNAEEQYKLLSQVVGGAGIVFSGADDKRVLKEQNRVKTPPPFLAGPVGDAFMVGKGRGMRLPRRPNIDYYPGWEVDYDYWSERLGRAVLWAAGKEPKAQVEITLPPGGVSTGFSQELPTLTYRVLNANEATNLKAEIRIRKAGRPADMQEVALEPPYETPRTTTIMKWHGAGDYHADIRVLSNRGVEAWATAPFKITSKVNVTDVKLVQDWGEIGDFIAGSVALDGAPGPADELRVQLKDRRGRVLKRSAMPASAEKKEFDFQIEPWMPMLVTVEAVLYNPDGAGAEVSSAYKYFNVTKRNRGQFNFLIWDTPSGTLAPYAEESLAKTGMTLQLSGGTPPRHVAAYDAAWVPYTTRVLTPKSPEGIMQPFCWNDEAAVQKTVTALADQYKGARQHGVFVYSLGDENETLGCCLSPQCAKAYREYLKETYGSLEALNKSWGTEFKTWDEVGISKADDNEEANSLKNKNYPRWFDRQAFKSYNYVKYCQKYGAAYEAIDPQAKTGFEGAGTFSGGDDLDLIVRSLKFWSPYPGTADEVVRSIAPREMPRANWMGYTKDAETLLDKYWRMVTRGMDAVWWWRWDCIGAFHGWLAPDLRPYPAVKEIVKDTQVMRDGLGDLLLKSEMQDDGIALLYSYPSVFAHKLDQGASYGSYESAHLAAHDAIREVGLQFRYVTDRMMRLGEFDGSKYKVLFLVRAEAIGDKEAQVIRDFVSKGGTVIADLRPGLYDDHCKPRGAGVLDDLFGIKQDGRAAAVSVKENKMLATCRLDPSLKLAGGEAADTIAGAPVLITHRVGKGAAILLNLDMNAYKKMYLASAPEEEQGYALKWLTDAGVKWDLALHDAKGYHLGGLEVIRWKDGDQEIVALYRSGGLKQEATVTLDGARFVYDLRNRKALGQVEKFTTTILPNRASFFALCPQAAPAAKVTLDKAACDRGALVKGSVSAPGAAGLHAFRIRAKHDAQELDWLNQNVLAGNEAKAFDIPVALNDPSGKYEISAIDLFTNQAAKVEVEVK